MSRVPHGPDGGRSTIQGPVSLLIAPHVDFALLQELQDTLLASERLRWIATSGSRREGTSLQVLVIQPSTIDQLLAELPMVSALTPRPTDKRATIGLTLGRPMLPAQPVPQLPQQPTEQLTPSAVVPTPDIKAQAVSVLAEAREAQAQAIGAPTVELVVHPLPTFGDINRFQQVIAYGGVGKITDVVAMDDISGALFIMEGTTKERLTSALRSLFTNPIIDEDEATGRVKVFLPGGWNS